MSADDQAHVADNAARCNVVGDGPPQVWKDDHGWNCDQVTTCLTCGAVSFERLAEDVTWTGAIAAVAEGRPHRIPPAKSDAR